MKTKTGARDNPFPQGNWEEALAKQEAQGLLRTLHHKKGEGFLDFSTNDYLQLSSHPLVIVGAIQALQKYGTGPCSSRLIGGGYALLDELEAELAAWYGKERALVFPSGYQANVATLSAILSPSSLVIADKYIHKSLIDGIRLSGAKMVRYPHGDLVAMEKMLRTRRERYPHIVCVTESVFSMHGTQTDIEAFCSTAAQFGALSYVDDAHGFGVLQCDEKKRLKACDIVTTTFSKVIGGQGGAALGSETFIRYLVNFASGFIYTASLSPAIVGGALSALRLLPSLQKERAHLFDLITRFTSLRKRNGFQGDVSTTPIQPLPIGEARTACRIQSFLFEKKIFAVAIRPPTVPQMNSSLRFSLCSSHSVEDLEYLFKALQEAFA